MWTTLFSLTLATAVCSGVVAVVLTRNQYLAKCLERFTMTRTQHGLIALTLEQDGQGLPQRRFVVDDEHPRIKRSKRHGPAKIGQAGVITSAGSPGSFRVHCA